MRRLAGLSALAAAMLVCPVVSALADSIEEKAALCAACHGEKGMPVDPKFPIIWGQHTGYILIQLRDMKGGRRKNDVMMKAARRKNDVMAPIVEQMSDEDMLAYAEYFDAKEWPSTGYTAGDADQAKGEELGVSGQCFTCHLGSYQGISAIPRLAGQSAEYLIKTTHDFKTHDRANNANMSNLMASYSDADIAATSRYLAGQ